MNSNVRINRFVANATGLSRRAADKLIEAGQVKVNGKPAETGTQVSADDTVLFGWQKLKLPEKSLTILFNKPAGYVCSRNGQGSKTIYDLLPPELHNIKPVGRLDKDSSGLLLMTDDGELAHKLTHPSFQKEKVYEVELDKPLAPEDKIKIEQGVRLEDGPSRLSLQGLGQNWQVKMHEGRNRQIRRTLAALGYTITKLHRTHFGGYVLHDLRPGSYKTVQGRPHFRYT
ncbi:MAG TPA: pseudouridine synthase [Candidatus Saccharimonadales bacterium]|jgi:23S rRNA pseudouridine2605 synthase